MFTETTQVLAGAAAKKAAYLNQSMGKYLVASSWAGMFVGIGAMLAMVVGGFASTTGTPYTRLFMGLVFGIALSLVVMVGAELFTGNHLIMMVGSLDKKVTWKDTLKVWGASFIGNFIGSIIIGVLFFYTDIEGTSAGQFILNVAADKMNGDFMTLLVRGILCNLLVCLAVMCSIKLKSESGKLIMIFWCLLAFTTIGLEHSIANMAIFTMALMMEHPETVSMAGMFANLIPVTIGNFIGGALLLGSTYYYMGKE